MSFIRSFLPLALLLLIADIVDCQFARTGGVNFILDDKPFPFAGTNIYDAALQGPEYAKAAVQAVKTAGYSVLRAWAFNEHDTALNPNPPTVYFQSWTSGKPTINNDSQNGLGVLDTLVAAAEQAGIKLILTLTNNWSDYGGMDVYVNNTISTGNKYHDLFYTDPTIAEYYQTYIKAVISRFGQSPAILAWELANEARCAGTGSNPQSPSCNPAVLTTWVDRMSTFIKGDAGIDPNHLVTTGFEGMFNRPETADYVFEYDGGSGQDYDALIKLPHIDFGTQHVYLGDDTASYMDLDFTMQWLKDHEAASVAANKPMINEEYGVSGKKFNRLQVEGEWHAYTLSSQSINGDIIWGSIAVDSSSCSSQEVSGANVYLICPSDPDYQDLVPGWTQRMSDKVKGA